jgi:AMP nucleosidase
MLHAPPNPSLKSFTSAEEAVSYLETLYNNAIQELRTSFESYSHKEGDSHDHVRAFYPLIRIRNERHSHNIDTRLSYGFLADTGTFETTITRPDLYRTYLCEQLKLIQSNHPYIEFEIGYSKMQIPIHFAFKEGEHIESQLTPEKIRHMRDYFAMPELSITDDAIADGNQYENKDGVAPLALFSAPRIDYSLHRLRHYTGTDSKHVQSFVLFTNYQFYIDQFIQYAEEMMTKTDDPVEQKKRSKYLYFVRPGNGVMLNENCPAPDGVLAQAPQVGNFQMPAYHLVSKDKLGITMINIGVGPSNAKTITDHVAVLRPYAWIMLGHCAGLRASQKLGDYALAHAYVREDHVLDDHLPPHIPLPALSEIQVALETAVGDITGKRGYELKSIMRTGTVVTTDNRNWELDEHRRLIQKFSQNRAIALDMESATIAANGFRFRVPYGTLLCVSDKPLQGEIKLPGMANRFYKEQVAQHLRIGIRAIDYLKEHMLETLHSRKLRSFFEPAFQ